MTAKELFDSMLLENDECTSTEMMIEFAKIHVEAALKEVKDVVYENITGRDWDMPYCTITNAYPISNIK